MLTRLSLTSLFNIIDLIITVLLVSMFGIGIEVNPIGVALFNSGYLLLLYKIILVNICLFIMYKFRELKVARVGSWVVFVTYLSLTVYHLYGLFLLGKGS